MTDAELADFRLGTLHSRAMSAKAMVYDARQYLWATTGCYFPTKGEAMLLETATELRALADDIEQAVNVRSKAATP